jgi:predicted MFS family arabinose efflux permease
MVALDFSTAILIFLFYLLVGQMSIVPLMAITMIVLYGIQGAYQPAVQASVPVLVDAEQLMRGNSVVNLITSLASMLGPVIGGILFSAVGLTPILIVSVACFLASTVLELFIRIPFEKSPARGNIFVTGFTDLKASFGFMFRTRPVLWRVSFIYASVNLLLTSLISIGLPVLITQRLGFEPDTANRLYGYSQGVLAAGAVLGGALAGVLSSRLKLKSSPLLLIGCALSVLLCGIALQAFTGAMEIYIVLTLGGGLLVALSTVFQIQIMSCIGILTPKDLIGKVIACVICVCMCTNPLGSLIYGIVFERIGGYRYLPFYAAAFIMIGIGVCTRRIFYGVDRLMDGAR